MNNQKSAHLSKKNNFMKNMKPLTSKPDKENEFSIGQFHQYKIHRHILTKESSLEGSSQVGKFSVKNPQNHAQSAIDSSMVNHSQGGNTMSKRYFTPSCCYDESAHFSSHAGGELMDSQQSDASDTIKYLSVARMPESFSCAAPVKRNQYKQQLQSHVETSDFGRNDLHEESKTMNRIHSPQVTKFDESNQEDCSVQRILTEAESRIAW